MDSLLPVLAIVACFAPITVIFREWYQTGRHVSTIGRW